LSISGAEFFVEDELISVLTTQPLERTLDYRAPEGGCHLGAFVEVPLGPRKVLGVVWGIGRGDFDLSKVRQVLRVLDAAPMKPELRAFLQRAGDYTLTPMPAMLRLATRAPGLGDPPQGIHGASGPPLAGEPDPRVHREHGVALGIEYERRLNDRFGIGGILEHTYGELDVWVYAVSFAYHSGPWRLYAAPGIEDTHHGSEKMLRLGVEYGSPAGRWIIAPQFDIDFVEREAEVLVIGERFARGFNF